MADIQVSAQPPVLPPSRPALIPLSVFPATEFTINDLATCLTCSTRERLSAEVSGQGRVMAAITEKSATCMCII